MRPLGSSSRASADSPGCELREALREQRVEPGQAIGAGDGDDIPIGEVDDGASACLTLDECALLAQRVAVVLRRVADGTGEAT